MFLLRSLYRLFFPKKTISREKSFSEEDVNFLRSLQATFREGKKTSISIPIRTLESKVYQPRFSTINCLPMKGNISRGEEICLQTLQKHYRRPFYRVRPSFLRNPETGKNLEIDCFNAELGIGCEYNGKQHYHYPSFPGDTVKAFVKRVRRDLYKIKTCQEVGVYLLVVPYTVKEEDIPAFILSRLPK